MDNMFYKKLGYKKVGFNDSQINVHQSGIVYMVDYIKNVLIS